MPNKTNPMYIIRGDVTEPIDTGKPVLIAHCCNDIFVMGSGVAYALFKKWYGVRGQYINWGKSYPKPTLGDVLFIKVEDNIEVADMIGQHDINDENGVPPYRHDAFKSGFKKICEHAIKTGADVHLPYLIGCDRAGGKWSDVEQLIKEEFIDKGVQVYIYDLFNQKQ